MNSTLSRRLLAPEQDEERSVSGRLLTSRSTPLSEDWALRGLGWGGKKIYERGFWKDAISEEENVEMEVLNRDETEDEIMDGIIEDEDGDDKKEKAQPGKQEMHARIVRVARAALKIGKAVHGFVFVPPSTPEGRGEWMVEGVLTEKVARWKEEERKEWEEEERCLRGARWDEDSMEVDEEEIARRMLVTKARTITRTRTKSRL